jgi:GNAT superfamily N-acetyltransferase
MKLLESNKDFMQLRKRLLDGIYRDDPCYRDSTTPLLKMLLASSSCFASHNEQLPVIVTGNAGGPLVAAVFTIAGEMPDILQVGFFEALPGHQEAVEMLLGRAGEIARERRLKRVVIGLDGHVNHGLGFLVDGNGSPACFGSRYNPSYYIDYLQRHASSEETLLSYFYDLTVSSMDAERSVIDRVSRRFKVRKGNFREMRGEIEIYTRLNNECFKNHPLYSKRSMDEDYELFRSFGPFLKEENFLVSELAGRPVGFLLWYPDFHELVRPGGKLGLITALKYRLPWNPVSRFKMVEFGVLPEFHGSGAIAGLLSTMLEIGKENGHSCCESGWILESNAKSKGVAGRWADRPYKTYKVFTIDMIRSAE